MEEFWICRDCAVKLLLLAAAKFLLLIFHLAAFQFQHFDEDRARVMPRTLSKYFAQGIGGLGKFKLAG